MSEFEENIINDEELQEVSGGTAQAAVKVKPRSMRKVTD